MAGLKNFLQFVYTNYVTILVCLGLIVGIIQKVKNYFSKTTEERVEIAKAQIKQTILRLITSAEIDFKDWNEAGKLKRAQTIQTIYQLYPIVSKVADQESMVAFIDEQIDEALKTLRKIVENNNGVPTTATPQ